MGRWWPGSGRLVRDAGLGGSRLPLRAAGPDAAVVPVPHRGQALFLAEHPDQGADLGAVDAGRGERHAGVALDCWRVGSSGQRVDLVWGEGLDQVGGGADAELAKDGAGAGAGAAGRADGGASQRQRCGGGRCRWYRL